MHLRRPLWLNAISLLLSCFCAAMVVGCQSLRSKIPPLATAPIEINSPSVSEEEFWSDHNRLLLSLLRATENLQRGPLCDGWVVRRGGESRLLATEFHGFPWEPKDFQQVALIGYYSNSRLKSRQVREGFGVPVVLIRHRTDRPSNPRLDSSGTGDLSGDFLGETSCFAATAVLSPDGCSLRFYNPVAMREVDYEGAQMALGYDLTASIAYALHHHPQSRIQDFLRPDRSEDPSRLTMLEPYQPDKIPLILIHGLLSSPDTFGELYNQLRTDPELMDAYQVWVFKYATGKPFIRAASELRSELDRVVSVFDPELENEQLRSGVIVGHSMGGLISRLMISYSGERVWDSVSRVPLEQIATDESTRMRLAERFYFDPHPIISRAVFIATPHRGSSTAGRAMGRFASALVVQSDGSFDKLSRDNPGAIRESLSDGLPTSIDMLDPNQPFLNVLNQLQLSPSVPRHSIIGVGGPLGFGGQLFSQSQTDGLVPLESARMEGVASEKLLRTNHNGILKDSKTATELARILKEHLEIVDRFGRTCEHDSK